jgi:hypothetical protein
MTVRGKTGTEGHTIRLEYLKIVEAKFRMSIVADIDSVKRPAAGGV